MKLRRNEYCPIHRSLFCCGREQARKERRFQLGVQRTEDPHHPRGYRELRSPAQMRKLLNRKIRHSWVRTSEVDLTVPGGFAHRLSRSEPMTRKRSGGGGRNWVLSSVLKTPKLLIT